MKKIGIGVLAVAFMSNCFLTGYLNEGLKPYNTVTGAQAKQIINAAAGSAWTTALQMYGTSLTTRKFANITAGYSFTGSADIGDVYEQRALAGAIAAASKTIVDDEYYTIASLNDCVDNIRNTMIFFGQGRLEEADKSSENCLVETNAAIQANGGDLNKVLANACFAADGTSGTTSAVCAGCVITFTGYNGGQGAFAGTGATAALTRTNLAAVDYPRYIMGKYADIISTNAAPDTMRAFRDGCMDNFMAAFVGKAAKTGCGGKYGEERIHEALSTTAFMGAQRCQLKKAGSVIQTDFFSL